MTALEKDNLLNVKKTTTRKLHHGKPKVPLRKGLPDGIQTPKARVDPTTMYRPISETVQVQVGAMEMSSKDVSRYLEIEIAGRILAPHFDFITMKKEEFADFLWWVGFYPLNIEVL